MALETYKLDPCYYYTSPGLSWEACLKRTNVRLELLNDIDHLLFLEKGIRGGVSTISNRHAKANNPKPHRLRPVKSEHVHRVLGR